MLSAPGSSLNQLPSRMKKKSVATSGKIALPRLPATFSAKSASASDTISTMLPRTPWGGRTSPRRAWRKPSPTRSRSSTSMISVVRNVLDILPPNHGMGIGSAGRLTTGSAP